ncbi:MAG: hypothetical protein AAB478_02255 [Patescibacteria group bacterium]
MSKIPTLQQAEKTLAANLYTLLVRHHKTRTRIRMQLLIPQVSTRYFPLTSQLLLLYLPSIFRSSCYNDDKLPFPQEVTRTELGHLFEHILLEYLCIVQLERGLDTATYEGRTNWNWVRDPRGTFHITIHTTEEEIPVFRQALTRTMTLMNIILGESDLASSLTIPSQTTRH